MPCLCRREQRDSWKSSLTWSLSPSGFTVKPIQTHTHTHQRNLRNDECCKTTWPITCLLIGGLISRLIRPIRVMCCCCLKSESVLQTCKGEYCLLSLPCERSQTHLTEIEISFLKIQRNASPPHHHQCLVFSVWWRSKMLHQLPLQT